ncbi:cytochrome b/b6 domain-containing protein [Paraburkholderia fungorum]|jgi:thiosulfate reductase cytochrome b subunit|uniref:Cytochrome b/b6 domain-containing protein n=1 Tax=Paraburkholderia fungorum TaxID=134537 RepID=A0AAJ3SSW9_9BURK|nr:cytochrome b/b6 domain-containing protein [Paraburkholderia fungorum]AJZ56351.1 prokaryotic cytochrome b561 family protein [Paraburkholderia fungorum]MBB4516633.1 thiosulfate reductase cytochrome b subunit [Paraburkholderia fungorum]MBB5545109.1 thiosulfate reductase cytochrome b subunit [Paraburkholderia fungorum]MBB6204894.1 thiosulfate reductase cytochrome b subunit [Paraburkholderia fungorum]MBU7442480.1 cytochrome b/b6 domain-containing protein [Paraburkholderia fungorum]
MPSSDAAISRSDSLYYRHTLPVRIMHWINVIAFFVLLMSGLQIFNAHPALYWGKSSYTGRPPILQLVAKETDDGKVVGVTRVFGREFVTTGVLGASRGPDGDLVGRGFPSWATIPGPPWLALGRRWHLFFAWIFVINGLAYVIHAILSRHLVRDLLPTKADWHSIGKSLKDHLLLRHPKGEAAKHYNILQKLTYLIVIFGLLPLAILMGWAMSPWLDSIIPGWVDWFGGRQSARTIHFVVALALVAFVVIHVFQVIITGLWNNLRAIITGRYRIPPTEDRHDTE